MKKDHKRIILRSGRAEKSDWDILQTDMKGAEKRYGKDLEDWPERTGNRISRRHKQSDDMKPLRRFLRKKVGTPWNKVWSEICEANKGDSVDAWHFRRHASREVDWEGRWIQYHGYWGTLGEPTGFYVDEHGILQYTEFRRVWSSIRNYKPKVWSGNEAYPVRYGQNKRYVKDNGWKELTYNGGWWDRFGYYHTDGTRIPNPGLEFSDHPYKLSDDKKWIIRPGLRSLSKKEIAALGL